MLRLSQSSAIGFQLRSSLGFGAGKNVPEPYSQEITVDDWLLSRQFGQVGVDDVLTAANLENRTSSNE